MPHRPPTPGTGTLRTRNARAGPTGRSGAFGGRTVARQRREPAERGSCPAARPRRGWGSRALSSSRARPTRSPTPSRPRRPRARPRGAAGEHSGAGRGPRGVTLGRRPPAPGLWALTPRAGRAGRRCSLCFLVGKVGPGRGRWARFARSLVAARSPRAGPALWTLRKGVQRPQTRLGARRRPDRGQGAWWPSR